MMISSRTFPGYLFLLFVFLSIYGCSGFKAVSTYAAASSLTLRQCAERGYGHYEYGKDSALIYNSHPAHLNSADCHCESLRDLDTITAKEFRLLGKYFATLARFADKRIELSNGDLSDLIKEGNYGGINITGTEASISNGITEGVTGLWATRYKNNKLKSFIGLYQDSVAPLIAFLAIRASSLSARIVNLKISLDRIADSLMNTSAEPELKWTILHIHSLKQTELDQKYRQSQEIQKKLREVSEGAELMVKNSENLKSKSLQDKLSNLVSNLMSTAQF